MYILKHVGSAELRRVGKRRGYGHDKYTSIDTFYIVRLEKKGRDAESAQHGLAIFVTEKLRIQLPSNFK